MSGITRPTEARPAEVEKLVEDAGSVPKLACVAVIEHLRLLGPNARVCILANTEEVIEYACLTGPNGLLRDFPAEFSRRTKMQFNHKGGGMVRCYSAGLRKASQYVQGSIFSLLWVENFDASEQNAMDLLKNARYCLRIGNNPQEIHSKEGLIVTSF